MFLTENSITRHYCKHTKTKITGFQRKSSYHGEIRIYIIVTEGVNCFKYQGYYFPYGKEKMAEQIYRSQWSNKEVANQGFRTNLVQKLTRIRVHKTAPISMFT